MDNKCLQALNPVEPDEHTEVEYNDVPLDLSSKRRRRPPQKWTPSVPSKSTVSTHDVAAQQVRTYILSII